MKNKLSIASSVLLTIVFLIIGFIYFDFKPIIEKILQAKWSYVVLAGFLLFVSHVIRALRWQVLMNTFCSKVSLKTSLLSFLGGTFVNLLIPHLGDVYRCVLVEKQSQCKKSIVLGSVIIERVIDIVILSFLFLALVFWDKSLFYGFYSEISHLTVNGFQKTNLFIGLSIFIFLVVGLIYYANRGKNNRIKKRVFDIYNNLKIGLRSINNINDKLLFYATNLMLWILYFLVTYILLNSLPDTQYIPSSLSLLILVGGSIGLAGPTQGGVGIFHYIVFQTLFNNGISPNESILLGVFLHGTYIVFDVVFGLIALVLIFRPSFSKIT